jgi:predicted ArsR family transcriptional regulator
VPFSLFELVADPVRLAIMRELSGTASVPLAAIAEQAGLHANTVRTHMGELEASGAVEREHAASDGPGRPQVRYRLRPGWRLPSSDLHGLSELLAALVTRLDPPVETIQELGRHWGRYLSGRPGGDPLQTLPRLLERLGFDAEVKGLEVCLRSCPCPIVSPEHPELICRLAGAAIDGIAETSPHRLRVSSTTHDPERRTCTIMLAPRPAVR